jgi:hypothetical protein
VRWIFLFYYSFFFVILGIVTLAMIPRLRVSVVNVILFVPGAFLGVLGFMKLWLSFWAWVIAVPRGGYVGVSPLVAYGVMLLCFRGNPEEGKLLKIMARPRGRF